MQAQLNLANIHDGREKMATHTTNTVYAKIKVKLQQDLSRSGALPAVLAPNS
jgi:hypothetical protein